MFTGGVLTYESVMPAAVYKSERSRRQLIGGVDVCRIVAVEFPGAFCRMQQAEGIQARDFLRKRRCDGDLPSAEQIRKAFAEIIIPMGGCIFRLASDPDALLLWEQFLKKQSDNEVHGLMRARELLAFYTQLYLTRSMQLRGTAGVSRL